MVWKTPWTLRLSTRSHEAVSCSASGAPQVAPALLTSTSTWSVGPPPPLRPADVPPSSVDRSAANPVHDPSRDSSATVASTASALREATTTSAPAATKPPAIIRADPPGAPGHHHGLAGHREQRRREGWVPRSRSWFPLRSSHGSDGSATAAHGERLRTGCYRAGRGGTDASGTDRRTGRAQGRAAGLLRRPGGRGARIGLEPSPPTPATSGGWARTGGWASAGRRSTGARPAAPSTR